VHEEGIVRNVGNERGRSRRRTLSCARCDKDRLPVSVHSSAPPPPPAEAARRLGGEGELLLLLRLAGLVLLLPLHCILGVRRGRGGGGMGCTGDASSELLLLLLLLLLLMSDSSSSLKSGSNSQLRSCCQVAIAAASFDFSIASVNSRTDSSRKCRTSRSPSIALSYRRSLSRADNSIHDLQVQLNDVRNTC